MSKKNFVSFGDSETIFAEVVSELNKRAKIFRGTIKEWNALTTDQKKNYDKASIPNSIDGNMFFPSDHVTFDKTGSSLLSDNVEAAIKELESNFQDGVDDIYNAVVAKGSTPASKSLSDVVAGIGAIQTSLPTQTKSCTPSTSAQTITPDSGYLLSSVSVSAISTQTKSCTPSTSAQTITPDSGKYLTSVSVGAIPNQRGRSGQAAGNKCWTYNNRVYFGVEYGWYPSGSSWGGMSDVCERYVDYANVASAVGLTAGKLLSGQSCLGINGTGATPTQEKTITASRSNQTVTPDSGKHLSKVTVNKYPDASGTYTPTSITSAADMTATNNYRYVDTRKVPGQYYKSVTWYRTIQAYSASITVTVAGTYYIYATAWQGATFTLDQGSTRIYSGGTAWYEGTRSISANTVMKMNCNQTQAMVLILFRIGS